MLDFQSTLLNYSLRKYEGDQICEWPEVEYSPMPGLPPIKIPGCDPDCEHEWGNEQIIKRGHPGDKSTLVGTQTAELSKAAGSKGQFCQRCGGWRGALGHEPELTMYIGHLVADRLGLDCIGIDISMTYAEMAKERVEGDAPLLADVVVVIGGGK